MREPTPELKLWLEGHMEGRTPPEPLLWALMAIKKAMQILRTFLLVSVSPNGQQYLANLGDAPSLPIRNLLKILLKLS
jgi:hypothetical protein